MPRITAACPESLISDANQLAMCLAFGPADGQTYRAAYWKDAQNNLYSAASWEATDEWVGAAQTTLVRPAWDTTNLVDMAAAARAQAALVLSVVSIAATSNKLTAIAGMSGPAALQAMGLAPITMSD